ncbi:MULTISPECIES: maltose alpha-D-glucosyltransferase [Ralstonia solanacearum species complex]|uniref:maltose alpha-D-glucosyltransferase n=1 Tax=Ralstonia solanacearum species complex TaxID=3116862 RepID=UPI000E5900A8|nr:maltose alpha-D-glucosyltransferase [Ralstonia solanacearum]BEU73827.1 maltose alpha-D-glucosyltransferase [Ralstonia pseudosolanacearum]AXV78758.1 maltose alpha-D-glucosyltransferase [Ralstonia solanacearum]AXV92781.1 maltose alpha-D-glucosyltransferase [Ralstonia solanacearum]AXW20852.1 maltose alpha-D-glucosyltransferase [Ralstonia solanacearum]AXW77678.1 maltose alpha-D-glucosyltransferase [Ralstonia solanacearum]
MTRNPTVLLVDDALWYKDAVIYQLHVKSFCDSNNDGVGDLPGLISKLDYIAELGVDAVWLLPFYPSPRRDDGYDIADYRGVHPDYGTMADARRFIAEAHARGLRVITELVINHTSDQHPWFQRARRAKSGSALRDFYVWSDHDKKYAGTRIIFIDTEPSNWTWDPVANAYYWHRFYSHQPDLNFDNPRVLKAVLGVMKFWLNLGVDGLRLDAVPYLVEREGTANENLPETHAVLRKIRAAMDAEFKNRLLLAEANQWPEDTQEYFGDGDECHMAFHFPLMPRMYMAIAREDRFPITDIMRQTPEVPSTCQWAIFLRNHDELTLEMVTDAERDYLWEVYASDRRARLNLGIRRRLAPLLERDRRRVELMNSLLFSMPGTPVMYYGDEIGMGDNIHLGDRDGVRTPMQWSPDRNGGFSRADPEQLVLPAIMGSLYGYESVNVEAQTRDAHSLLNWTRRMLATRKRHRVFGRGSIQFLHPANRKVLAYVRALEGEAPILCVANLSRASQAVELDLAAYAQRVPVELIGGTAFPPIGQLPYLLTLPPYAFYWLELRENEPGPSWAQPAAEQLPEFTTLVLRAGLDALSDTRQREAHRQLIEREILPSYLPKRRWFAAKDSVLRGAHFVWGATVPVDASSTNRPLAGATRPEIFINEIAVTLGDADGTERTERYLLPLSIAWESATLPALPIQLALARVRRGRHVGYLTDAFTTETFARALLAGLVRGVTLEANEGTVRFEPEPNLVEPAEPAPEADAGAARPAPLPLAPDAPVRWLAAEQSNSSLVIGESIIVKLIRRVAAGVHPEVEMTRHLTRIGYANTAALIGEIAHVSAAGERSTLAVIQSFVPNQGDAWTWALDYLRRTIDELAVLTEAVSTGDGDAAPAAVSEARTDTDEALAGYLAFIGGIGTRLGELHVALASPSEDAAFGTSAADAADAAYWIACVSEQVTRALDHLTAWQAVNGSNADLDWLLSQRDALLAAARERAQGGLGALLARIHGDFHLGQVLVAQGDAFLIDFEGEPSRPVEERRRKTSPLRDVAGLVRSLDYVVGAMRQGPEHVAGPAQERRDQLLERFRNASTERFLDAYAAAVQAPESDDGACALDMDLLDLFLLEKAAYEVNYEAANRPSWLPIPLTGLACVARRLLHAEVPSPAVQDPPGGLP